VHNNLRVEDGDRVRVITFARPAVLNAFDTELYDALADALADGAGDDGIGAVVITGEGRAFSAGADLAEMADLGAGRSPRPGPDRGFPRVLRLLQAYPKPILAAVNGLGVGFGFTVLAHCDIVFVARSARMRAPFVHLGVAPEAASSYLFPLRMGWQRAAHVLFTGDWVSAEELVAGGLALAVCDDDAVVAETLALARRIAAGALPSIVATKQLMVAARGDAIQRALDREGQAFAGLLGHGANAAALDEFLGQGAAR
jgi:enoyl-CoA hydratase/carnithine racemase